MPNTLKLIKTCAFLLTPFLAGCSSEAVSSIFSSSETLYNVTIVDGEGFSVDANSKRVAKGKDAYFTLNFDEGFDYSSCSYAGARYISPLGKTGTLVLPCVTYPLRVEISVTEVAFSITYHANGGEIGYSDSDSYTFSYNPKNHLRSNVDIGTAYLSREGYILTGWNSSPDGDEERTGLGSRISFEKGEKKDLYAVWAKQQSEKDFDVWQNEEGKWAIRGYDGDKNVDALAIPSKVSGIPIDTIETGAFSGLSVGAVVLPSSLKSVEDEAFSNCEPFDLYLYDSLGSFGENPFGGCVKTLYLNAILPPSFLDLTYEPSVADRVDALLLSKGKKRLILFSGCSLAYAVDSPRIEQELNGEYMVLDWSVTGDTGGLFQFQMLEALLGENDTVVHFPEPGSPFQLLADNSVDNRAFMAVEGNWDILQYVNVNELPGFFPHLATFNTMKAEKRITSCAYDDDCHVFNEYGDFVGDPRDKAVEDAVYNGNQYTYGMDWANAGTCTALANEYTKLKEAGVEDVYFSYSPVNYSGLPQEDKENRVWERFAEVYENEYTGMPKYGFSVLGDATDALMNGKYFFDADYHPNIYGRDLFTDRLLPHLKSALGGKR